MKYSSTSAAVKRFGVAVGMATVLHSPAVQAGPSSWKNFTSGSTQPWSALANWTATTGVPATSDPTLVINFDPAQPGTTTSSGKINNSFTSTNDLGIVQINALNLGGAPNTVAEVIKIYGGALQFEGAGAVLSNSTTLNAIGSNVTYSVYNSIALDTDLSLAGNGTGPLNLAYSGGTISAMGGVLRTITITGSANWGLASSYTSAIIDGDGQVRIVMAGSGTLTLTSTNPAPFSGGMVIKSGAVTESGGSAGSMTFGQGPITLGDTNGSASAALQFIHTQTQTQPLTVAAGSTGTKSLQYTGTGSQTPTWIGPITLNGDLTLDVSGTSLGSTFIIGTSSSTNYLAGAGSLISSVNAGTGANQLNGNNTNWTGNVFVNAGKFQVNSGPRSAAPASSPASRS